MQQMEVPVRTICMGQAASFSSLLLAAGSPGIRYAFPNARIMIQQNFGEAFRQAIDMFIQKNELDSIRANLYAAYVKETGRERTKYLSPQEAKDFGLIDVVLEPSAG